MKKILQPISFNQNFHYTLVPLRYKKQNLKIMETFYFTLGVLSIIAIIFIVALVWGLVMVVRTKKDLKELESSYSREMEYSQRRLDDQRRELDITVDHVHRRIEEVHQESRSHTDKRADQLIQVLDKLKS